MSKENTLFKLNKKIIFCSIVLIILLLSFLLTGTRSVILGEDIEVEVDTDLIYYLKVNYDGVDNNGVSSITTNSGNVKAYSGYIYVEDKIPDGLTFKGFVKTEDGSIGAVNKITGDSCLGEVVDDTDGTETTNSYHGLHYDEASRVVSFKAYGVQAGCQLTVGIITRTPSTVDDPKTSVVELRRDFYNTATAREDFITRTSNTVHSYMLEDEPVTLYNVTYRYTGTVPDGAPTLPTVGKYAANSSVAVATNPVLLGYKFSGWTTSGATITSGSFKMPAKNVTLSGSWTKLDSHKVTYQIVGDVPLGYVVPREKEYYQDQVVNLDSMKAGDIFNGYRFLGWETTDAAITSNHDFIMPNADVKIVGKFELITYNVRYQFVGDIIPPDSSKYLPATKSYVPGSIVSLAHVSDIPGYHFRGWEEGNNFPMPEEDVLIVGEWEIQNGVFSPSIKKEIINQQEVYSVGDVVQFKITVTNTADYDIKNVNVIENNERAKFIKGEGYSLRTDRLVVVDYLYANSSVTITAEYEVTTKDKGTITNEVEIIGAEADNNYNLDTSKEYKARAQFKVYSKLNICKLVNGAYKNQVFQFHITNSDETYDSWINLEKDECRSIYIDSGKYSITEILPQDYVIKNINYSQNLTGESHGNTAVLTIGNDMNYEITFTNKYVRKGFFHSTGRLVNNIFSKKN